MRDGIGGGNAGGGAAGIDAGGIAAVAQSYLS